MADEGQEPQLGDREALFVLHFLGKANCNATEAARLAGYSDPNANGSRIRRQPAVAAEIKRQLAERAIGEEELLARIGQAARAEHTRFLIPLSGGKFRVDTKGLAEAGLLHLVIGYKMTEAGPVIEFANQIQAQALAARLLGLQNPKGEEPTRDDSIGAALDRKLAGLAAAIGAQPLPGEPDA